MSSEIDNKCEVDAELSSAYREIAAETTPQDLDRAILRLANQELQSPSGAAWRDRWYRPLAIVATVTLSLALILQLNESSLFAPPAGMTDWSTEIAPVSESAFQDAAGAAAEQLRQMETPAGTSMTETAPATSVLDLGRSPSDTGSLLPASNRCSDEQRAVADSWWLCIKDLESKGLTQGAELELLALLRAHPQFIVPQ